MHCPRCGALLVEHDTTGRWFRFFRCEECWVDWYYSKGQLVRGKHPCQVSAQDSGGTNTPDNGF